MTEDLITEFHSAMLSIYNDALRLNPPYRAAYFIKMVNQHGGKGAADRLLAPGDPAAGFTELYLRGKESLKLSVEYLVLQNPWRKLFTVEQLSIARQRLIKVKCDLPTDDTTP